MMYDPPHLSDQQLLLDADGELSKRDEKMVRTHLEACWQCRARRQELQNAIGGFVREYQAEFAEFKAELPPSAGPRALLKATLAQLSASQAGRPVRWFLMARALAAAAAICAILVLGFILTRLSLSRRTASGVADVVILVPDSRLTPGAALLVSRPAVCAEPGAKNKTVSLAVQQKVFAEYGIRGADPTAYEVDYLVTPALGGADDIHNLWPHSYASTWNARVKDALEDRLREMVCDGAVDLTEAQREIASNWIAAYRKYFHTDMPLAEHCGPCMR